MDALTHSLVGLTSAKAGLERLSPGAVAVCILSANAPDIDVVSGFFGGRWTLLHHHRGVSHSIVGTLALGFLIPSIFTPLHDTRMEKETGVTQTRQLTPLQWQLMMKCWKMNLRPGQYSWWGPLAWRVGSLGMWLYKLRRLNGPHFTWPLLMFSGAISEKNLQRMGKIYEGKPLKVKTRKELIASLKPRDWQYLRADNGDMPIEFIPQVESREMVADIA